MDLTTCSVCVIAGSAGGAVSGYYAAGRRGVRRPGRRAATRSTHGRTMRSWPGARRRHRRRPGG
ncbi:hypothetical protein [Pseudonocardia alaniniphila]|uniref:Uncharacterized protein n=1 Tax=Pseudonocardia alaniniphila TaxID=75291 RepID=A0ABS9TBK4_9PSEU|nr:hypothetical protein [Pseudonocardia alaniniphila]MCH6165903.1 hypothetical protein [Pseudonocardia alaniniphila]